MTASALSLLAIEFNGTSSMLKTYNSTFTISQPDTFSIVYRSADANTATRAFVFDFNGTLSHDEHVSFAV